MLNLALPTIQNIVTCNVLLNCDGCKYTYSLIYLLSASSQKITGWLGTGLKK